MANLANIHLNKSNTTIKDDDITVLVTANVDYSTSSEHNHKSNVPLYDKTILQQSYPNKDILFKHIGYDGLNETEIYNGSVAIINVINKRGIKYDFDCLILYAYEMGWIQPIPNPALPNPVLESSPPSLKLQTVEAPIYRHIPKKKNRHNRSVQSSNFKQSHFEHLHNNTYNPSQHEQHEQHEQHITPNDETESVQSQSQSQSQSTIEYNGENIINDEISKGKESCTLL